MTEMREKITDLITANLDAAAKERSEGKVSSEWLTGFCVAYERLTLALLSQSSPSGGGMMCLPSPSAHQESSMAGAASRNVAPLEWKEPSSKTNYVWIAKTILGTFCVGHEDGWYAILDNGIEYWEWEPDLDPRAYSGPLSAQKACQEYYEQKIRSALSVSDEQPKAEATNVAEPAGCQRGGVAETPSNQSLQEGMVLWCCHVRASDDVHPAPDYATALRWADWINDCFKPRHEYDPIMKAVPAPWPWSPERHAENLERTIAEFTPRAPSSISQEQEKGI